MLTKVKSLLLLTANNIIKYLILSVKKKRGAEVIEFTVVFQRQLCTSIHTHNSQSNVKYDNFINPYFLYMLSLYLALALACMWLLITVHLHTILYYLLLAFTRKSSEEVKCWKYSQRYIKFFYLEYWSLVMRRF